MHESGYVRWFEAIFKGEWRRVPDGEPIPSDVLDDSSAWASLLLDEKSNPYKSGALIESHMYLGLKMSPDKLVSAVRVDVDDIIAITETLQHFIVQCGKVQDLKSGSVHEAVTTLESTWLKVFSPDARSIVGNVIRTARALPENVAKDSAVLLSTLKMPIGAITHWFDQAGLFFFAGGLHLDFPKAYPSNAAPIFKPGLDWYPTELRARFGVPRG
ncbi:MAG TPA: hypothetical protein VN687_01200 [Blastocatellia bacterium]|nr:hypothetical protein [Blastocatellia bacterium]